MLTITKNATSVKFDWGDTIAVHPLGTMMAVADTESDAVNFKVLASRKTIYSERFDDITPSGEDAVETAEMLAVYLN